MRVAKKIAKKVLLRDGHRWGVWKYREDNKTLLWADGKHTIGWDEDTNSVADYYIDLEEIFDKSDIDSWIRHLTHTKRETKNLDMDDLERAFKDLFPQLYN
jgi:hypothetical protein